LIISALKNTSAERCAFVYDHRGQRRRLRVTDEKRRATDVGLKNNIDTALWRWDKEGLQGRGMMIRGKGGLR
jgi:hypothetical protein